MKEKAASWIVPPCRFNFFVILVFTIIEGTKEIVRRVLRRGKALVTKAYIAWTNERNEHGAFVPERTHPFRSSSSDVHQSIFRSKGDLQFKDRAVPVQALDGSCGALEPTASEGNLRFPSDRAPCHLCVVQFCSAMRWL